MKRMTIPAADLLKRVRAQKPLIHHITNWVTIYDCANVVKVFGASPVMAHAPEEAGQMAGIASALVLNIGTLTTALIQAMKIAAKAANKKGIPVVLDVCGAGATALRDTSCFELLGECRIDIIKGNVSEIARVGGESVTTKGVDASNVSADLAAIARKLAVSRSCAVVVTGAEDIVTDGKKTFMVRNGHALMGHVVGTGCMAASVIGTFAAVEKDPVLAAASGLVCFEVAAELAAKTGHGPASFKEELFDHIYSLDASSLKRLQKVYA